MDDKKSVILHVLEEEKSLGFAFMYTLTTGTLSHPGVFEFPVSAASQM